VSKEGDSDVDQTEEARNKYIATIFANQLTAKSFM
jgi:hypothetical protein